MIFVFQPSWLMILLFPTFMVNNPFCFQPSWSMVLVSKLHGRWSLFSNLHGWWSLFLTFMVDDPCLQPSWLMILFPTFMIVDPCFQSSWLVIFVSNFHGWWFVSNIYVDDLFSTIWHPCPKRFNWNILTTMAFWNFHI